MTGQDKLPKASFDANEKIFKDFRRGGNMSYAAYPKDTCWNCKLHKKDQTLKRGLCKDCFTISYGISNAMEEYAHFGMKMNDTLHWIQAEKQIFAERRDLFAKEKNDKKSK